MALYGTQTWTTDNREENYLNFYEMWTWKRMQKWDSVGQDKRKTKLFFIKERKTQLFGTYGMIESLYWHSIEEEGVEEKDKKREVSLRECKGNGIQWRGCVCSYYTSWMIHWSIWVDVYLHYFIQFLSNAYQSPLQSTYFCDLRWSKH